MGIEKKIKKKAVTKTEIQKPTTKEVLKTKSIARFFGINPNEEDGMTYQKRVRSEW